MHSIPVFFVSDRYTIIICGGGICGGGLIGNRIPERKIARRGTFAPLPCASAYCQKNFKKTMKNREKGLDIPLNTGTQGFSRIKVGVGEILLMPL